MKPEIQKIVNAAKKCQGLFSKGKDTLYCGVSTFANLKNILEKDGDTLNPESLEAFALMIRSTMEMAKAGGHYDGDISFCQELVDDMQKFCKQEIRNHFLALIGREKVEYLESNYKVEYDKEFYFISSQPTDNIEIKFLETDNVGDIVCFFNLCYNFQNDEFYTEDCCSRETDPSGTYEVIRKHNPKKKKDILNNNFKWVDLP